MLARLRKMQEENEGGFTLIELLVVIIIIGILAAIAIPVFLNQRKKGYDAATKSDLRNLATAEETYLTDFNAYQGTLATVVTAEGFKSSANVGTPAITLDGTTAGYCLSAKSASGNVFWYDSENGGLLSQAQAAAPAGGACKSTATAGT